jgi:hypothetical protein
VNYGNAHAMFLEIDEQVARGLRNVQDISFLNLKLLQTRHYIVQLFINETEIPQPITAHGFAALIEADDWCVIVA